MASQIRIPPLQNQPADVFFAFLLFWLPLALNSICLLRSRQDHCQEVKEVKEVTGEHFSDFCVGKRSSKNEGKHCPSLPKFFKYLVHEEVFGTPKGLLRRCLGVQAPTHMVFGRLGLHPQKLAKFYRLTETPSLKPTASLPLKISLAVPTPNHCIFMGRTASFTESRRFFEFGGSKIFCSNFPLKNWGKIGTEPYN